MPEEQQRFYGKYRGQVSDNQDPNNMGRIRARVPAVFGELDSGWALPCVPYAGDGIGFYMIPPVGANVWIEFEAGSLSSPVWTGCFWASGQLPNDPNPDIKIIKTDTHTITLDDTSGEEKIEVLHKDGSAILLDNDGIHVTQSGGANIIIDASSITVDNNGPKITLEASSITIDNNGQKIELGAASVTINGSALEVM
ncbi:MAG: baseplate assembly protein [Anaerolinea sp.]|nr:baseplate assembly protein [Anaerolinea sp.]